MKKCVKEKKLEFIKITLVVIIALLMGIFLGKIDDIVNWLPTYQSSNIRNVLEIIYFLTTPLLLIVTILGLKQITVAKNTAKENERRESYKLALEKSSCYVKEIIMKSLVVFEYLKEKDIDSFGTSSIQVKNKNLKVKTNFTVDMDSQEKYNEFITIANEIDVFAVCFVAGVAEEKIAYDIVGEHYIELVEKLLPIIGVNGIQSYGNLLNLYYKWKERSKEKQYVVNRINDRETEIEIEYKI